MTKFRNPSPPRWADRLLEWYCAPHLLEDLQGDLHERFYSRLKNNGVHAANLHFIVDALTFLRPYILKRRKSSNQNSHPMLLNHYFKTAFRNVKRDKQYLGINTIGLALGIGFSLMLIAYIFTELSYDRHVHAADRVYRISCSTIIDSKQTDFAPIPPAIGLALKNALPDVEGMTRLMTWSGNAGSSTISYNDKLFYQRDIMIADSTVFDILDYEFLIGDKRALQQPNRIVLTHTLAEKILGPNYAAKKDLLQTIIRIDDHELGISGVMKDLPYATHLRTQAVVGWQGFGNDEVWDDSHAYTFIRVVPGTDRIGLQKKMDLFIGTNENIKRVAEQFGAKVNVFIQPLTDIHLYSDKTYELQPPGNIQYIYAFALVALFFLLSSGINYANLSIAASAHRIKEIGVRKVIGALRYQIQRQFIIESFLLTCCAFLVGLLIFYFLLPYFNLLMDYRLNAELLINPLFISLALSILIILSLLSGYYPAFYFSALNPITVFKNKYSGHGRMQFRKILLIVQFSISSMMIIAVFVVSAQISYLSEKSLGFNKDNVMVISVPGPAMKLLPVLKEEILKLSAVKGATVTDYMPGISNMIDEHYVERSNGEMQSSTVSRLHIDKDYLSLLGLPIIQGRNFDPSNMADYQSSFLVNETAVRAYGWNESPQGPIGRKINGFNYGKEGTVVGVVRDANLFSLRQKVQPLIINLTVYGSFLYVMIDGSQTLDAIGQITTAYSKVIANQPLEYQFLDERFERLYDADRKMSKALAAGAQVLIIISCIGLFGLSAFMVVRRTKEIGVRKILGASIRQILVLLSGEYVRLILIANLMAAVVVYFLMNRWLDGYAYRIDISWWILIVPIIFTLVLAWISISFQVIRAARSNPVNSLRYE